MACTGAKLCQSALLQAIARQNDGGEAAFRRLIAYHSAFKRVPAIMYLMASVRRMLEDLLSLHDMS